MAATDVAHRHHRFATDGTWDKLLRVIQAEADAAGRVDELMATERIYPGARVSTGSVGGPGALRC